MDLKEYKQLYYNFEMSINQTRLISLAAGETLKEFPKRLPPEARNAMSNKFQSFAQRILKSIGSEEEKVDSKEIPIHFSERTEGKDSPSPFFIPWINLNIARIIAGKDTEQTTDFNNLLYAQELAMLFAHLDAFMGDSLRVMCRKEPRLLHRSKKMSWDSIIASGSWESLLEKMIEEYSYDFGWKSVNEKIQYLQTEHGLTIDTSPDDLNQLDDAEKTRNIVIHNGSRVSQEYLDRTMRTDVKVGDLIPISADYIQRISSLVRFVGIDVFMAVARKFFHATESEFMGIWQRVESNLDDVQDKTNS